MNLPTIFLAILMVVGAVMALFLIGGTAVTTPVDSSGTTVSNDTINRTTNATDLMRTGTSAGPWIAVILAILMIGAVFFWALTKGGSGGYGGSRYH